ncbi:ribosome biogenesis GTPase YqeH [Aureibacillus halotolerans]
MLVCAGCGVPIQTEHENAPGFAPASALEREQLVCRRCFRLSHYNEVTPTAIGEKEFLEIANTISQKPALVVKVVDLFDFQGSWISGIQRFAGNNDILLIGNKVDLLPKSINEEKVRKWMRGQARDWGVKVVDSALVSSQTGRGVEAAATYMSKYAKGRDVYVVGCTNVGKSSFINQLIKTYGAAEEAVITTSAHPGTTLGLIEIPLEQNQSLYDTPGLINRHQMAHVVSAEDYKVVFPKKEVKPRVYQLQSAQTIFFGGLARLDVVDNQADVVCFMSNELHLHRTKLEKADELYQTHVGGLLQPPTEETRESFPDLKEKSFSISEKTDIVISGLGWITIRPKNKVTVRVHAPEASGVFKRVPLI